MIKNLQSIYGINVDATKKAVSDMKRGAFVKVDEVAGTLVPALTTAEVQGVVVRDVIVDDDVAQGIPVSDWSETQDTVKKDEFAGIRVLLKGEKWATDQHGIANDEDATAGLKLDVVNGQLVKAVTNSVSNIVSLGFMQVAGHKMLGYKVV